MRKLALPVASTLVMLAILISLGVWQLHRLAWKTELLAHIDAAEHLPAIPMPDAPAPFQKVRLEGSFRPDLEALYAFELRGEMPGAHLIVPLERAGQPAVLVDLGFVPDAMKRPIAVSASSVDGFVRPAEQAGTFSGTDSPGELHFYTLDPAKIGAALGLARVAPYTLVALGPPVPGQFPDPAHAMPRPTNDHLHYALTWFGFALTLLVIFGLYARKALRS
jgi:surfeit locus 1 family protein